MKLKLNKSYKMLLFLAVLLGAVICAFLPGEGKTAYAALNSETKLFRAEFDYSSYLCTNTSEVLKSSGNGVTVCTANATEYGTADVYFDIYGSSYKGEGTLKNGGYLNSSTVHVIANSGWSTSSMTLKNQSGQTVASGSVSLSASLNDGLYTVVYEGAGQGWLVNQREYNHYRITCEFTFGVDTVKPYIEGISETITYVNENTTVTPFDALSGISSLYMKTPSGTAFNQVSFPYTLSKEGQNGKYLFYTLDNSGNKSPEYQVFIDTVKPQIKVKKDGYETEDKFIAGNVSVTATDNGMIDKIYISEDGGEYKEFNGTVKENVYLKFRALDKAGNESDERTVYVDTLNPSGKICNIEGNQLTGQYVSSKNGIRYLAEDTGSGIKKRLVKSPNASAFKEYNGSLLNEEGEYQFYSMDNAGNKSDTVSITLDNTSPLVKVYAGENESASYYISASYIKFYAEDNCALDKISVTYEGTEIPYNVMDQLKEEGTYTVYASDRAGNKSFVRTVILDRTAPSAYIYEDTNYTEKSVLNGKSFSLLVYDTYSGVKSAIVKKDDGTFENYTNLREISDEGYYTFIFEDYSGNVSEALNIILDRTAPKAFFVDVTECNGKLYSNTNPQFSCQDSYGIEFVMYKSQCDLTYKDYVLGDYLEDGSYSFYATDIAGNSTDIMNVTVDRVKPLLKLYSGDTLLNNVNSVNNTIRVYVEDENTKSILTLLPGESAYIDYSEGTVLSQEGLYSFYSEDKAGNISDVKTVRIDKTGPEITLYSGSNKIDSGTSVNTSVTAMSEDPSGSSLYVKLPGSDIYSLYSGESLCQDGLYFFYAVDGVMNSSAEYSVTIDTVKPFGLIYAEGSETKSLYTNAKYISFESCDSLSGICKEYVTVGDDKREYKGEILSFEGHYIFSCVDNAGNESNLYEIYLDRTKPTGIINPNGRLYTNKPFSYVSSDNTLVSASYIKMPGMDFARYEDGTVITSLTDGRYLFYCMDMAGNRSDYSEIIVDLISPIGFILKDNSEYKDEYINGAFSYVSERDITLYVSGPSDTDFRPYDGSLIEAVALNGTYSFYAEDPAGNLSVVTSVILDTIRPNQYIYSDGYKILSQFINSDFTCVSEDENGIKETYIEFNANTALYSGETVKKEGTYLVWSVDNAGNISEKVTVTLDKTKPELKLYGIFDELYSEYVNEERIYMNCFDDNLSASYIKRPSKSSYEPYTLLSMYSEEGKYSFYSADKAGNISDIKTVTIDRTKDYPEISGIKDGTIDTSAVISWKNNGLSPVKSVTVNGKEVSNGEEVFVVDGGRYTVILEDEAGNRGVITFEGKSDLFKKTSLKDWYEGEKDGKIYSFASMDNAEEYAGENVRHCFYFEKDPAEEYEGENVYKSSYTLQYIKLPSHLKTYIDGEEISGSYYQIEGVHSVEIKDAFSCSKKYEITVINSKEKMYLDNDVLTESEYYLSREKKVYIDSADEDAVLIVKNSIGEVVEILSNHEEFSITIPYVSVCAVNRYGTSKQVAINLSLSMAEIDFSEDTSSKKLTVSFKGSEDKNARIRSVKIYKNTEGTWIELSKDDYRKEIGISALSYSFRSSGKYRAVIEDNFRSGDNAVTLEYEFKKAPPEINITDVSEYYINYDVEVSFEDEGYIVLKKDGREIPFKSGKISDEGEYELLFSDYDSNTLEYSFVIDKTAPEISLNGCTENGVTNKNVEIITKETDVKLTVIKNGKETDIKAGDIISEPGDYFATLEDMAGNASVCSFKIDKKVDYSISTLNGGISSEDVIINSSENITISLLKDNKSVNITPGERITDEGYYTGNIEDDAGNKEGLNFRILKSKVQTFTLDLKDNIHIVSAYKNETSYSSSSPFVFNEDGRYSVTITDGNKTSTFVIIIDTTPPEIVLNGVMNGGKTKKSVSVESVSEECSMKAYLNGRPVAFSEDTVFTDEGVYSLYFEDAAGNETDISFEIKKGPDGMVIFLIILMVIIIVVLIVFLIRSKKKNGPDLKEHVTVENQAEDEEKKDIKDDYILSHEKTEEEIKTDEEIALRDECLKGLLKDSGEGADEEEKIPDELIAERDFLYSEDNRSMLEKLVFKENSFAEGFSDGFIDKGLIKGGDIYG